ncbi:hypothetical protein DPMN_146635 [Dreissena polymorpha]|uniref:Uncharacterized protein n=1 Tax=Dreissena polymorpha TaxID=45954 RepID=A0A9D4IZW5_DREPO|nr:hypothetical protein DPMN_146635 [Dreissena polymorpha]
MACAMCKKPFEARAKGFKRKPLINKKRSEIDIGDLFDIDVTPGAKERFLCDKCDQLTSIATRGNTAKNQLFEASSEKKLLKEKKDTVNATKATKRAVYQHTVNVNAQKKAASESSTIACGGLDSEETETS